MLLNVYKSSSREPRDKVDVLAAERRTAAENTELRARLSELEKLTQGGDVGTAFRVSRQQVEELSRQLDSKKQDEDALIAEMDSIGQSFQDMQEQNSRLLQQLNEKDDANFQLMSERLKASQLQQMLRDEKDIIEGKMAAMQAQVEAQNELLKKFEERERAIHEQLDVAEKDGLLKIQLIEGFKRKAVDLSAEVQQNNAVLERLKEAHDKLEEALRVKTEQAETLANKELKLVDENNYLQAKIGKSKKLELKDKTKISDKSESQQYRQLIFCPICRTNVKDTVMLRCFHSFCNECVQKRYDTRQRACPTCAKQFGANDFQRFYL
ncbi:ring finger protein 20 [Capsaspora owczarzaki ATCC 30864]|uniref:E3 ubiquitin protein ligase n=1 Tax=Capsaspora owczarzaki (strain ATCC 30864) TaxID=595528 RepID=A0A0D2WWW8_CAPO3|nr:ring finger protein 20 [Capsaspora owczarzaki ATCC 30864]KJE97555.1 ring finger protein 20 [Capsaspora owczarzaki ATCC 30864]|eukprot:XP_004343252.2 ring finger protein 20 [Capsaspora owczarzaki ATCC 30864]